MKVKILLPAAVLTITACSQATAPGESQADDIIGVVSTQQAPYFDGNTMRVTVTNLRLAPSANTGTTLNVAVAPSAVVRVARHGCDVRDGQRSEIKSGLEISIRLTRESKSSAGAYQAAHVTITY